MSDNVTTIALKSAPTDFLNWFGSVDWSNPTWDLFIVLFFLVTVFLYGMSLGRDRIVITLISIYMSLAVVSNAPFLQGLQADVAVGQFFAFRISTFLGVFLALFFLLSRSSLLRNFGSMASGSWWQVLIFSTFHVGLLISITLSFLPQDALNHLAPQTLQVFTTETARFAWIAAPVVAMALIPGEKKED